MPIEYDTNPVKEYNPTLCEALGIQVPDGYVAYNPDAAESGASSTAESVAESAAE